MQRESRRVGPIAEEPLDSRLLLVLLVFFVVRTAGQDVVHLKTDKVIRISLLLVRYLTGRTKQSQVPEMSSFLTGPDLFKFHFGGPLPTIKGLVWTLNFFFFFIM